MKEKWPVRVTRGHQLKSSYAPLEVKKTIFFKIITNQDKKKRVIDMMVTIW
jgi:hypothetical protein